MKVIAQPLDPSAVYFSGDFVDDRKDLAEQIADIGLWCLRQGSVSIPSVDNLQIKNEESCMPAIWTFLAYTIFSPLTALGLLALHYSNSHAVNYQLYHKQQSFLTWSQQLTALHAEDKSPIDHIAKGVEQFDTAKIIEVILQQPTSFKWLAIELQKQPLPEFFAPLFQLNNDQFSQALYSACTDVEQFEKLHLLFPETHNRFMSHTPFAKAWRAKMTSHTFENGASMRAHIEQGLKAIQPLMVAIQVSKSPCFQFIADDVNNSEEMPDYLEKLIRADSSLFTAKLSEACPKMTIAIRALQKQL
jgi:hypothetical protein